MKVVPFQESTLTIDEDGVAVFEHQRPDARHPLSMALREDYAAMLDHVETQGARVLILTGSGAAFCGGGDVKTMHGRLDDGSQAKGVRKRLQDMHLWLKRLRDLSIPVIAAVDGPAWGGGFALALCADFVLATKRASFCMVFLRIGVVPDMAALHMLPRAIGMPKAKELMMTGRRVSGTEGMQLGFVHALHEPEELRAKAMVFARRFLSAPQLALGLTKQLTNRAYELDPAMSAELEGLAQMACANDDYHNDAVRRFVAKQPMRFDWDRQLDEEARSDA